jgi:hypothetical protein
MWVAALKDSVTLALTCAAGNGKREKNLFIDSWRDNLFCLNIKKKLARGVVIVFSPPRHSTPMPKEELASFLIMKCILIFYIINYSCSLLALQSLVNISIITLLVSINISDVCQKALQSEAVHTEVKHGGIYQLSMMQFTVCSFKKEQSIMHLIREQFSAFEIPH